MANETSFQFLNDPTVIAKQVHRVKARGILGKRHGTVDCTANLAQAWRKRRARFAQAQGPLAHPPPTVGMLASFDLLLS